MELSNKDWRAICLYLDMHDCCSMQLVSKKMYRAVNKRPFRIDTSYHYQSPMVQLRRRTLPFLSPSSSTDSLGSKSVASDRKRNAADVLRNTLAEALPVVNLPEFEFKQHGASRDQV